MKRIGVLTGGGDVPGLNPCIKTIGLSRHRRRLRSRRHSQRVGRPAELQPDDPAIAWPNIFCRWTSSASARSIAPAARSCTPAAPIPARSARQEVPAFLQGRDAARRQRPVRLHAARAASAGEAGHRRAGADRRRRHAELRRAPASRRACTSSRFPRRWTTTSSAPTTASASRRPSRAASSSSINCAPARAATSASPSSSCSGATAARRR